MRKSFYEYSQNKNFDNEFKYKTENIQNKTENVQSGFSNQNKNENNVFKNQNKNENRFSSNQNQDKNRFSNNQNNTDFNQEKIEETINKYKNMSQGDLLSNLYSEVSKQKMQGTFDPVKLENAISSFGGFLTPQQQNNMKELLRKLK